MKVMFTGFAAAILIAVGAYYGLHAIGFSSADTTASPSVRVGGAGPEGSYRP
ncbi:MAG: hypothetical protein VXZ18_05650 [Pseudomonadota bacterium]|jgi:hypothetical protein|uniref:Uncharacterized protein n=1 Tax=Thalassococcus halodurans TaxID=373675 RepID=A0A1H6A7Y1_9RHOB|nr:MULTISPECIES: hypothetical protein [Thalassococcus]MBO6867598.1 hypothetical protein [Thalassococcus sp.]MEC7668544.1 hypothetical protein [Pseudomonadota bacterium]MEC8580218.1 hypothetical protein [Pseudomonadota bacterium]SEG44849.1 hypothetical protein SAMN04488045_2907 [Thalassococcus halodurans]